MQIQPPFRAFFHMLNLIVSLRQRFDYPTAQLPVDFQAGPNLREGRSGFDDLSFRSEFSRSRPDPFVSTDVGNFEGYFMKVISGREIYAFEGIPYAEVPIRFHNPVPRRPFQGNFSAKSVGNSCYQTYLGLQVPTTYDRLYFGSEDCLFCNVYSPQISEDGQYPNLKVIFNIHGGAYELGAASDYGPSYLLEEELVLVTCNYRLGPFGFLSTGDEAAPGNFGLKDISLALDWTHKHISKFGGDPDRIIVTGESAGAALGHMLLMTPTSKGKIAGAIFQSASAFTSWAVMDAKLAQRMTRRFAMMNFCPTNQGNFKMIECLRGRGRLQIETAKNLIHVTEQVVFQFSPVIEPDIPGALLTKKPEKYYEEDLVLKVPIIFSENSRELDLVNIGIQNAGPWSLVGRALMALVPQLLGYRGRVRNEREVTRKILNFYGGRRSLLQDGDPFFEAWTYRYFTEGWRKSLRLHSQVAPTFAFIFGYRTKRGFAGRFLLKSKDYGVPHSEDLLYIFNRTDVEPISRTDPDFAVVKLYQNIFFNFATHGEPIYITDDNVEQRLTEPVKPPPSKTFKIFRISDDDVKMEDLPWETNETRFWDSLNIRDLQSH